MPDIAEGTLGKHFLEPNMMVKWIALHAAEVMFNNKVAGLQFLAYRSTTHGGCFATHCSAMGHVLNMMYTTPDNRDLTVQELLDVTFEDFMSLVMHERDTDGSSIH